MSSPNVSERATYALVLNQPALDDLRRAHGISTEAELARVIGVTYKTLWLVRKGTAPSNAFMTGVKIAFPHAPLDSLFSLVRTDKAA